MAQARTAFGGSSAAAPALFCRPGAWESAGDFWAYFRFQGMELLPFGGAERGTRAGGERGGTWVPRGWRRCPGTEVPSCPFRDPAEMGSACPIYCRRFPPGKLESRGRGESCFAVRARSLEPPHAVAMDGARAQNDEAWAAARMYKMRGVDSHMCQDLKCNLPREGISRNLQQQRYRLSL